LGIWWIGLNDNRGRRAFGLITGLAVVTIILGIFPGGVFRLFPGSVATLASASHGIARGKPARPRARQLSMAADSPDSASFRCQRIQSRRLDARRNIKYPVLVSELSDRDHGMHVVTTFNNTTR